MIKLEYPQVLEQIKEHLDPKRTESASFLIWYLENYYRLDAQEAVFSVCDEMGDKGVDGIYVNEANGTIDVFQVRMAQKKGKKIGDTALKEFYGTLSQFDSKKSIEQLKQSAGRAEIAKLIDRIGLLEKFDDYEIQGIFLSNTELDGNGKAYLDANPHFDFIGKNTLETTFISDSRMLPKQQTATFTIDSENTSQHFLDTKTYALIAPIKASELVLIPGIADQSVFAYNVRAPLGATKVNREIVASIKDKSLHKQFPLFHNGITIVTNSVEKQEDKLTLKEFFVVNGCQSLTALFENRTLLTPNLSILTKIVQIADKGMMTRITEFSNNQNGVKARDFKSNDTIQVRLQNDFIKNYGKEFFYEAKRGENSNGLTTISNENAGILLMAFDLKQPWATHRRYQVFEEKYNELFGRPEVTSHRIVMLHVIANAVSSQIGSITNTLVAKYALVRYVIMYVLREILEQDKSGKRLLTSPESFVATAELREKLNKAISSITGNVIIELNYEMKNTDEDFDYRAKLREEKWVKNLSKEIEKSYAKDVARGRAETFDSMWTKTPPTKSLPTANPKSTKKPLK